MTVQVLYFAALREALGCAGEEIALPSEVETAGQLRQYLAEREPSWQPLATMKNLRIAINQGMASPDARVRDGDEVAFFPPVTGG